MTVTGTRFRTEEDRESERSCLLADYGVHDEQDPERKETATSMLDDGDGNGSAGQFCLAASQGETIYHCSMTDRSEVSAEKLISDSLKFQIDKTHSGLVDSGKATTTAIGQVLTLLIVAILIMFNDKTGGVDESFELPLLGLKLSRWPAANVVLTLAGAATYRMLLLTRFHQLRLIRTEELLELAGWDKTTWAIEYPSLYTTSLFLSRTGDGHALGGLVGGLGLVAVLASTIGLPLGLLIHVLEESGSSILWLVAALTYLIAIVGLIALTIATVPARTFIAAVGRDLTEPT